MCSSQVSSVHVLNLMFSNWSLSPGSINRLTTGLESSPWSYTRHSSGSQTLWCLNYKIGALRYVWAKLGRSCACSSECSTKQIFSGVIVNFSRPVFNFTRKGSHRLAIADVEVQGNYQRRKWADVKWKYLHRVVSESVVWFPNPLAFKVRWGPCPVS